MKALTRLAFSIRLAGVKPELTKARRTPIS